MPLYTNINVPNKVKQILPYHDHTQYIVWYTLWTHNCLSIYHREGTREYNIFLTYDFFKNMPLYMLHLPFEYDKKFYVLER